MTKVAGGCGEGGELHLQNPSWGVAPPHRLVLLSCLRVWLIKGVWVGWFRKCWSDEKHLFGHIADHHLPTLGSMSAFYQSNRSNLWSRSLLLCRFQSLRVKQEKEIMKQSGWRSPQIDSNWLSSKTFTGSVQKNSCIWKQIPPSQIDLILIISINSFSFFHLFHFRLLKLTDANIPSYLQPTTKLEEEKVVSLLWCFVLFFNSLLL